MTKLVDLVDNKPVDVISMSLVEFKPDKLASPGTLAACKDQVEKLLIRAANTVPVPLNVNYDALRKQQNKGFADELRRLADSLELGIYPVVELVRIVSPVPTISITLRGS